MKKAVALLLAALFCMTVLASCGKAEAYEIDVNKVVSVYLTKYSEDNTVDRKEFTDAYNNAKVGGSAKTDATDGNTDVILYSITNSVFVAVYYMGGDKFIVSGTNIDTPYYISSSELADLYNSAADSN